MLLIIIKAMSTLSYSEKNIMIKVNDAGSIERREIDTNIAILSRSREYP